MKAESLAFPTAEGYGANAIGGRGGTVMQVNQLGDSGTGSLRACVEAMFPRTCVFTVPGTIVLNSTIAITQASQSYLTIAGQTAPHGGIQVRSAFGVSTALKIGGDVHDVIIRHLKWRPGSEGITAFENNNTHAYLIGSGALTTVYNIILDHVEGSWATYINMDFFGGVRNTTVQWSVFTGGDGRNDCNGIYPCANPGYSFGTIITAYVNTLHAPTISMHHNLFVDHEGRVPQYAGIIGGGNQAASIDFRNNYIYDWYSCNTGTFGGTGASPGADGPFDAHVNFVGNKYVINPTAPPGIAGCSFQFLGGSGSAFDTRVYVQDNSTPYCPGAPNCAVNEWDHRWVNDVTGSNLPAATEGRFRTFTPFPTPPVVTHSAASLEGVLVNGTAGAIGAGPRRPLIDGYLAQTFNEVVTKTGNRGKDYPGWPDLTTGGAPYPPDSDNDGIPDAYETQVLGTNPGNPADGATITASGYSNLELYLNQLAGDTGGMAPPVTGNPIFLSAGGHGDTPSDANTCAQAESIATPKATYASACQCIVVAGKRLFVRAGIYDEVIDTATCPLTSGTSAMAATTIEGYQNETAIFRLPVGQATLATIQTGQFLKLKKLTLDAQGQTNSTALYVKQPAQDIVIEDVTMRNTLFSCAFVEDAPRVTFTGHPTPALNGLRLHTCGHAGIRTRGVVDQLRVERGEIHTTGAPGLDLGVFNGTTTNAFIDRVIVRQAGTTPGNAAVEFGGGAGAVIQNSLIYRNTAGMRVYDATSTLRADNLDLVNNTTVALQCDTGATTIRLRNTNLWANGATLVNNCSLAQTTNNTADPNYTNEAIDDYTLQGISPAINAGTALPEVSGSFDGTARPAGIAWDIGAYERDTPPTPPDPLLKHRVPVYIQSWFQ